MNQKIPKVGKSQKIELIKRMLGLKHKLKVHDTMKAPDTHEELSSHIYSRWELEDELNAIEEILQKARFDSKEIKLEESLQEYVLSSGPKRTKKKE